MITAPLKRQKFSNLLKGALLIVVMLSAPGAALAEPTPDPLQPFNRAMFTFNDAVDRVFFRPLAVGYRAVLPQPVRNGVNNFFNNLRAPTTLLNDILQGKPKRAQETINRFLVNSTIGLLGFVDIATRLGFPEHQEDYGQTLAVWGIPAGPYIVLPLLGPSTLRDAVGKVPEFYIADPLWEPDDTAVTIARFSVRAVDIRSRLLDLDRVIKMQVDPYLFFRETYLQNRQRAILDGGQPDRSGVSKDIEQKLLEE
ncbi:MAG: ABC transporter [Acidiferrobacter sp.]|nr:ABC transporter [Acidiferrobacter sp.]